MTEQKMCRHYGYQVTPGDAQRSGPVCALGIDIRTLVGGPKLGWMARMPCVSTRLSKDVVPCDRVELMTNEEILREIRQGDEVVIDLLRKRGGGS